MIRTLFGLLGAALVVAAAPARADVVLLSLEAPVQTVAAGGGVLDYYATVSAPGTNLAAAYLNGVEVNLYPTNAILFSGNSFYDTVPLFLSPGDRFRGLLFTLTVPVSVAGSGYTGVVDLLGGARDDSQDGLGETTLRINVVGLPEPSRWAAMVAGVAAAGVALRRRRGAEPVSAR